MQQHHTSAKKAEECSHRVHHCNSSTSTYNSAISALVILNKIENSLDLRALHSKQPPLPRIL